MTNDERTPAIEPGEEERRTVRAEVIERLRNRGVSLTGEETGDELADVLDAVEQFETVVEDGGGDLMIDEPVRGRAPTEPDDVAFVLPRRRVGEAVGAFIERIADAAAGAVLRAGQRERDGGADARPALHRQRAAHPLGQAARDR